GYLRRERDEADGRNVFVAQTESGAEFLEAFGSLIAHASPNGGDKTNLISA
ncbi:MAG: MarR family transcriptional regulator, partial [Sphingomonadaceae bacterium]